jgi:hypothetical protein
MLKVGFGEQTIVSGTTAAEDAESIGRQSMSKTKRM